MPDPGPSALICVHLRLKISCFLSCQRFCPGEASDGTTSLHGAAFLTVHEVLPAFGRAGVAAVVHSPGARCPEGAGGAVPGTGSRPAGARPSSRCMGFCLRGALRLPSKSASYRCIGSIPRAVSRSLARRVPNRCTTLSHKGAAGRAVVAGGQPRGFVTAAVARGAIAPGSLGRRRRLSCAGLGHWSSGSAAHVS